MSDWDASDSDSPAANATSAPSKAPAVKPAKSKWADEDEEENVASDWEDSDEEEEKPKATSTATTSAPPKKKLTMKQKIAEKEAEKARRALEAPDELYDEAAVLNPREAALRARQMEMDSDMNNAADLFGATAFEDKDVEKLVSFDCRTKENFQDFTTLLIETVIKRQQKRPLYPFFVEHFARELAAPLKDSEVRKVASSLSTLANEKQKEARDAASGKKKKAAAKPVLGSTKASGRLDTSAYEESLDDFGNDDFM
ncbi:translation initiation factor eIF3 subunit [Schizopora paradoxa]|uniref:Eukaryotic translation initiation factor 3 subunit J n=1 Tax=Schizopora paradoxa TaxID=27342 RepID=A0A0H2RDW7_9AGAM|nr:translation initiation factor eIF3 subunit [Schizopora paradoxa]